MNRFEKEAGLIEESGLFDRRWYLAEYPDVSLLGMDPIEHFLWLGARLGRNPGPGFDTTHYLGSNPDVAEAGVNPLLHYITNGQAEGRSPKPHVVTSAETAAAVDVVVPVHNALADVKRCLESIETNHDGLELRVTVVNDASDAETTAWLRQFCDGDTPFELIELSSNQGYTKALNAGLRATRAPYVVALNSDTIVTPGWLRGLLRCMAARPQIGIVGPLSNAASWQNVPKLIGPDGSFAVNAVPAGMSAADMARLVAETSRRVYPAIPFVNGFCFMIRRAVIKAIGYMDESSFPEGYGEENDYCIRAQDAGFELAIADDAYVYHAKSRSFGHDKRKALSEKGTAALRRKHGARYAALVEQVKDTSRLDGVRRALAARLAAPAQPAGSPADPMSMRILFLLPVRGGGGGAHSVVQEASEMRRLGIDARIAVRATDLENFSKNYCDVPEFDGLFIGEQDQDVLALAADFDVVVATIFESVGQLAQIIDVHPHILPAYYVQDYEPLFFERGSEMRRRAKKSYELIPGALLFAKTHWIAEKVRSEHGVQVHKVEPSIDHAIYRPRPVLADRPICLTAMIRPQSPRRGAERTMRVLSRLTQHFGSQVAVELFGCADDDPGFAALSRNFDYRNHGVLKRAEVAELLARSDLFLDLSDYQAFGRAGLEAMACGSTAVVPENGGADEYAIDGVNTLVVDTASEDACFEHIAELLGAPARLTAMQSAALRTAARYSIHAAAVSELTLFAEHLARHRATCAKEEKPRLCLVPALTSGSGSSRVPTGSAHVRLLRPYYQPAVQRRWQVETRAAGDLPAPGEAEVVIVQRDPPVTGLDELASWCAALRRAGNCLVYEVDDDLLDVAGVQARGYGGDAQLLAQRVSLLAQQADLVTVSTEALATRLGPFNANVRVVPNYVDGSLWPLHRPRDHGEGPFARSAKVVRIGYIGTPTHDSDLELVAEAMQRIEVEYGGNVEIEVIGGFQCRTPTFGNRIGLPRNSTYPAFVDWLTKRVHWDIAIIPLADDAFNRCKSHLKFIECACLDLAIVCSDVECYASVARGEQNCLVASNDTQSWYDAIKTLIENAELRARLAAEARQDVIDRYTIAGNTDLYLEILAAAITDRPPRKSALLAAE